MSISGKISIGIRSAAPNPRMQTRISAATTVYGRPRTKATSFMSQPSSDSTQLAVEPLNKRQNQAAVARPHIIGEYVRTEKWLPSGSIAIKLHFNLKNKRRYRL